LPVSFPVQIIYRIVSYRKMDSWSTGHWHVDCIQTSANQNDYYHYHDYF